MSGPLATTARLSIWRLRAVPGGPAAIAAYEHANAAHLATHDAELPGAGSEAHWQAEATAEPDDLRAASRVQLVFTVADEIVGHCALRFARGPRQTAHLAFGLAHAAVGRGLAHEALARVLRDVHADLDVHRVEAQYLPENARAAALLARLGFRVEGVARGALRVRGAWRDLFVAARLPDDPLEAS